MSTKTELKPCPFCGKEAVVDDCGDHRYFVRCTNCCIAQDKLFWQKCDAIRRWNTRKTGDKLIISKTIINEDFKNIIKNAPFMFISPGTEEIKLIREQQWIPCSEKLPCDGDNILATIKDARYGNPVIIRNYDSEVEEDLIEAWMPLPLPYKEGE